MASGIGIKQDERTAEINALGIVKRDARLVAESIHRIINTLPYENPRNPMGCRIKEVLFEPSDYIAATLGSFYINDALTKYENRANVEYIDIALDKQNTKLIIKVVFRLVDNPEDLYYTNLTTEIG